MQQRRGGGKVGWMCVYVLELGSRQAGRSQKGNLGQDNDVSPVSQRRLLLVYEIRWDGFFEAVGADRKSVV